jgi:pimeloyl-ACP methyl ester carboxylesterase
VVLLHSAEFGGRAEFSWFASIGPLAEAGFHVLAPDMVGFGGTEKIFNFSDRNGFRVRHVRAFLDALGVTSAHFVGNSFGGSIIQTVASDPQPAWPIRSIVSVSGGGFAPDNDARKVLTHYDGSRDGMRRILQVMFWDPQWWRDEVVEQRWRASIEPGAWEAVAAARLAPPGVEKGFGSERGDPSRIRVPTLIVGGREDLLREPGCWEDLHARIPGSQLKIFSPARHCPHLEFPDEFNALAIDFLRQERAA